MNGVQNPDSAKKAILKGGRVSLYFVDSNLDCSYTSHPMKNSDFLHSVLLRKLSVRFQQTSSLRTAMKGSAPSLFNCLKKSWKNQTQTP